MSPDPSLPHGSWPSPITAALVVQAAAGLSDVQVDRSTGDIWWSESRPEEGGRIALVRRSPDGATSEPLPSDLSVRTRVHEYGGRAWWVSHGTVWFANWDDQRIWRLGPHDPEPIPVTPDPPTRHGWRYADGDVSPDGAWIACVRESHVNSDGSPRDEVTNEVVLVPSDGSADPVAVAAGTDFVAAPRFDQAGARLAWLVWDHPRMPWDGTELWVAALDGLDGPLPHLVDPQHVAGGPDEALVQPEWTPEGDLRIVSDRDEWWNLYRVGSRGGLEPLAPTKAEVATPPWVFGQSRYAELFDGRIVMALASDGTDRLAVLVGTSLHEVDTPFTAISAIRAVPEGIVCVAASPATEPAVVRIHLTGVTPEIEVLRPPRDLGLDPAWFSTPRPVSFLSGERTAHALHYPPTNPEVDAPDGELPPLLVMIHGGPTGAARPQLNLATQFWTSRGFAVVDVNYGGSTGYGRTYRRLLDEAWGIVDVEDCVNAARHLALEGHADPDRLLIRGGSAGGFTTLAALAFEDTFTAGASHYGVADLLALAADTHKFESRYLDSLVGPLPEAEAVYRDRSPIHHLDGFDRPLIVFQGTEDEIVPPNQSEAIVSALAERGVTVAYVAFEGEQHGFRQAPNIIRALESELWFYGHVLGFAPADAIEPVPLVTR